MAYRRLEIRRWTCERLGCDSMATTIGQEDAHGMPAGWVVTYGNPREASAPHHYCSEEHAREQAAAAVDVNQPWHRAEPFTLP